MDPVESMIREMNANLAAGRKPLTAMMDGDRSFRMKDGSEIEVPEEQLRRIWDACDDPGRIRMRLPFYVSTDAGSEGTAWKVEGAVAAAMAARLLGKTLRREGYLRLYNPDLMQLKKLVPDCYLMVFLPRGKIVFYRTCE